jgi:hypothetical protein
VTLFPYTTLFRSAVGLIDVALGGLSERQFVPRVEVMNVLLDVRGLLTAVPVP